MFKIDYCSKLSIKQLTTEHYTLLPMFSLCRNSCSPLFFTLNMDFTDKNIEIINRLSEDNQIVKKMYLEILSYKADGVKAFYIALNKKLVELSDQIESVTIDIEKTDDKIFDRVFDALIKGGKIAENLKILQKEQGGDKIPDSKRSMTDRWADENRSK